MNNSKMSFAANGGTKYSITCKNNSSADWIFYIYQKMPNQPRDIFSLAWFASPYKITRGGQIKFEWSIEYSFLWSNSGELKPGVSFNATQVIPCDLKKKNQTTFSMIDNTPQLSPATSGGQSGSLTINQGENIPNKVFSTGIGMSGQGTFAQTALANTTQTYTPEPEYYVAGGHSEQMGVVLADTVTMAERFQFPPSQFNAIAELNGSQEWDISYR